MRKNKKAQAVLPFFGLQLASVIVFLVVVITLLLMRRNLVMFANEFDLETERILLSRRFLSSTDCFAFEERDSYYYNSNGQSLFLTGSRVYPYLIDVTKIEDPFHFNCMRKDFFDTPAIADSGLIDIFQGTGAAAKYEISVIDLYTGEIITTTPSGTFYASSIGFLDKTGTGCFWNLAELNRCKIRYGKDSQCAGASWWHAIKTLGQGDGVCVGDDGVYRVLKYDYEPITYDFTSYSDFNCSEYSTQEIRRSSFPVILKKEDGLHPGVIHIRNCVIAGSGYDGIPFCERIFKTTGEEGC